MVTANGSCKCGGKCAKCATTNFGPGRPGPATTGESPEAPGQEPYTSPQEEGEYRAKQAGIEKKSDNARVSPASPGIDEEEYEYETRGVPPGIKRVNNSWSDAAREASALARKASVRTLKITHERGQEAKGRASIALDSTHVASEASKGSDHWAAQEAHAKAGADHIAVATSLERAGWDKEAAGHRKAAEAHWKAADEHEKLTTNAFDLGRHGDSGRFQHPSKGFGKGAVHAAARDGGDHGIDVTPAQQALGNDAARQDSLGHNPPSWVVDETKWEAAKKAAAKGDYDEPYAVTAHIYQQMGGQVKGATKNMLTENAWSDAAREAAKLAKEASAKTRKAAAESDKTGGVDGDERTKGAGEAWGHSRKAIASEKPEEAAEHHFDAAMKHNEVGEQHHALGHRTAADAHFKAGAAHLRAARALMTHNASPAVEGFKGFDGDNDADDYQLGIPNTQAEHQWASDQAEPLGDEDHSIGQGDRPPDAGGLFRQTGKSKKDETHPAASRAPYMPTANGAPARKPTTLREITETGSSNRINNQAEDRPGMPASYRKDQAMNDVHEASEHALGASAATECEGAQKHAKGAVDKSAGGDHDGAAIAHLKAAQAHEGDSADNDNKDESAGHDRAALLHRKAAQMHLMTNNHSSQEVPTMSRESLLKRLTANCSNEERAALARLSTPTLQRLVANAKKKNDDEDEDEDDEDMEENDGAAGKAEGSNADAGAIGSKQAGGAGTIDEYPKPTKTGTATRPLPNATGNAAQRWWDSAPPEVQEATRHYMQWQKGQKTAIVNQLVANVADRKRKKTMAANLMNKSLDELKDLASLIPQRQTNNEASFGERPPWEEPATLGIFDAPTVNELAENAANEGGVDPTAVAPHDLAMNLTNNSQRELFAKDRLKRGALDGNSAGIFFNENVG